MARASAKSSATATPFAEQAEAAPAKDNRGRELLELRTRWKIINEMVEAGLAERKRLREAIDSFGNKAKQHKAEE